MDNKVSAPVEPETTEDVLKLEEIRRVYETGLPIVQELRNNPDYLEADVYGNYSEEDKKQRFTSGPLKGSRGLALQVRLFSRLPLCNMLQTCRRKESLGQRNCRTEPFNYFALD